MPMELSRQHELDIFARQRHLSGLSQDQSRHELLAKQDHFKSFLRNSFPSASTLIPREGSRSGPVSASCLSSKSVLQPESLIRGSRDASAKRPPSLAATHPYKYLDQHATDIDGNPHKQKNMPDQKSSSEVWIPITPESLPGASMSPSPEPQAKTKSSMGPPPVPQRHRLMTPTTSSSPCSSRTTSYRSPPGNESCSSARCLPHTHLLDPMMQHSKSPTLWLYDANVDRRDTDLANGNVTSPLAMIGLPLGGMVEMANYYPPDKGHRWEN
nr:hypothetical protein CFP56_71455 [Quercus suber]